MLIAARLITPNFALGDHADKEGVEQMGQELWLVVASVGVLAVLSQFFGWGSDRSGDRKL